MTARGISLSAPVLHGENDPQHYSRGWSKLFIAVPFISALDAPRDTRANLGNFEVVPAVPNDRDGLCTPRP